MADPGLFFAAALAYVRLTLTGLIGCEWRNTPALCPLLLCEFSFACCDTAAHPHFARLDLCAILSSVGPEVSVMG
jgi:hypothetical protein